MSRLLPRSLAARMATLIALALFVAQAVNFGLAVRDRREFRLAQATRPAAIRIADALEREAQGRRLSADRGRVRRLPADPVRADAPRAPSEVAVELRRQLTELGIPAGRIDVGLVARPAEDLRRQSLRSSGRERGRMLMLAVEQPGRGWLMVLAPWPRFEPRLLLALLVQTLILYAAVLLPVLWIARRISQPLKRLTAAAAGFDPTAPVAPLAEEGPPDLRQLVTAFNTLQRRVTTMLEEKDRMLGAIGHDLRTPLAALRVRIESVEDETDRARMIDTVTGMDRTLDDILSLARIGHPSEPPTEVDLAALADAVVDDFDAIGAPVTMAESGRVLVRLRPNLMRRAVRNLIENAVKYGGGAAVRLETSLGRVAIVVDDEGPGIPPERLPAVFDPFVRLEGSRNRDSGGIGLGLALARSIVREAGGEVQLENRAGGGLQARIVLPRQLSPDGSAS